MVFSDEMLLDIKEGLLLCLPEVDREPPRAKEERHVCVFARVAAKEVILGIYPKKSDVYCIEMKRKQAKIVTSKAITTTYLKSLSERTPNLPATYCSLELLLRHS